MAKKCLVYETLGNITAMKVKESLGNNEIRLSGVFGVCGIKNGNNRIYSKENYGQMVESLQKTIATEGCLGELEHPNSMNINLNNVSHKIESVQMHEDGTITGTVVLLDTEKGRNAKAIVEAGVPLYISSRALGSIDESGNVTLTMLKTYDLVGTPGFSQASLHLDENQKFESLNESMCAVILEGEDDNNDDPNKDKDKDKDKTNMKDSKKMTDEKILEVVPKFIQKIPYECIILSNKEYNEKYADGYNMNKLKAILHNKALMNLKNKYSDYDYIVVDQFAEKYVYFSYLKASSNVVRDITFMTKAEDKCLAVACASLISRFVFLKEFGKISKEVGELLPKGASTEVDKKAAVIAEKYGFNKLNEIAKINFKNTEKVKELLNNK